MAGRVEPVDHKYVKVAVPPFKLARAVPLQSPLQFKGLGLALIEAVNGKGCVTITVFVTEHPFTSVKIRV